MANYILRKCDDTLWAQFAKRAKAEGHTLRWLLLTLIASYVRNGLPK